MARYVTITARGDTGGARRSAAVYICGVVLTYQDRAADAAVIREAAAAPREERELSAAKYHESFSKLSNNTCNVFFKKFDNSEIRSRVR